MPELSRSEVLDLLPWFAAGSLSEADAQRVTDWLAQHGDADPQVRAELDWLRQTFDQAKSSVHLQLPPADQGLDTLMRRVRSESAAAPQRAAPAVPSAPVRTPWLALWNWLRHPTPVRGLALAGLALAQAAVIVVLLQRPPDTGQMPLSDPRLPSLRDGVLLQVTFVPSATEVQIRTALRQAQATLVAGPGTLGVYTVVVPRALAERSTATLRLHAGVVDSVQAVPRP